jgi:hypothetical protein
MHCLIRRGTHGPAVALLGVSWLFGPWPGLTTSSRASITM